MPPPKTFVEELPDDYDVSTEAKKLTVEAEPPAPVPIAEADRQRSEGVGAGGGGRDCGGLRRGFFNREAPPRVSAGAPAAAASSGSRPVKSLKEVLPAAALEAAEAEAARAALAASATVHEVVSEAVGPESKLARDEEEAETVEAGVDGFAASAFQRSPENLTEGLRERLRSAAASSTSSDSATVGRSETELQGVLRSMSSPNGRWPTAQARNAWERATTEIDVNLAEMRSSSNDVRRLRSGDEKHAMGSLRRAADDLGERLRKAASAVKEGAAAAARAAGGGERDEAVQAERAIAAFHALPFTAKLRVLADERVAFALFFAVFSAGAAFALGVLVEVYTAWNCGFRCEGRA